MLKKRPTKKPTDRDRARAALRVVETAPEVAATPDEAADEAPPPEIEHPPIDPLYAHDSVGEALKAVRLDLGLTLAELAEKTRVRKSYLEALEEMRLDALPSRPFTIGYVRAYATALGLDPDLATERFKTDEPVLDEPLRAPVGVLDEKDPRVAAFMAGAIVIIAAIVLWNVAQRALIAGAPPPPLAPEAVTEKALTQLRGGTMELGEPLPAPVDSTTPPAYETPGLATALGLAPDAVASGPKPVDTGPTIDISTLPPVFVPQGKIYDSGAPGQSSVVTLQALKGAALILRGADGSVYFARQLSKGEAFRVPQIQGLTVDVSRADDFQVFVYGQARGVLPASQVLASKLVTAPPTPAVAKAPPPAAAAVPPPTAPAPKAPPAKPPDKPAA